MIKSLVLITSVVLAACVGAQTDYKPQPNRVTAPKYSIKRMIEQQPSNLAALTRYVEVTDEKIQFYAIDQSTGNKIAVDRLADGRLVVWSVDEDQRSEILPIEIYYKNIGKVRLVYHGHNTWTADIIDKAGYFFYSIYSYDEAESKQFIDAVTYMMQQVN